MGFLDTDLSAVGTAVQIDTGRGEPLPAAVAPLPFYKPAKA